MKIQSNNRLIHYQAELTTLQEQTTMLNHQLPGLQAQITSLENYMMLHAGDRNARKEYTRTRQRYNSICAALRRNAMRMQTLQRQISMEYGRIYSAQQRMRY